MNDRTIISDVLKEVNGFIDSLDDDVTEDEGPAEGRTMPPLLDVCSIKGMGGCLAANGTDYGGLDAAMEQSEALYCRLNKSYSNADPGRTAHDEVYDLASPRFGIEDKSPASCSDSTSSSVENKPPARKHHGRKLSTPFQARARQKTPLQSKVQAKPLQSKQGNNLVGKRGLPTQSRVHKSTSDQFDGRCSNEATTEHARSSKSQKKLSLLLKVADHPPNTQSNPDDIDDNGYGPILFPLLNDEDGPSAANFGGNNPNRPGVQPGEVILVNPNAFENAETSATRIAGRVTVETARLVADVSQISSEDWARSYSFSHVMWSQNGNDGTSTSLARTIVEEAMSGSHGDGLSNSGMLQHNLPCTSVVFVAGGYRTGKSQTVFGTKVARLLSTDRTFSSSPRNLNSETGLTQQIVDIVLSSQCRCTISVLEIGSTLYDVLSQHDVQMRYVDNCGAILPDLHEVKVESARELDKTLSQLFSGRTTGHGHLVVTLTISTSNGSSQIKLVDLASPDRLNGDVSSNVQVRKSLSALRGVLRGVCHVDHSFTEPTTFRDSLLTQVLQRCLTNASDPKCHRGQSITMIGTVSPSSMEYNQTLSTMDYLTRLTSKAGDTAKGPFDRHPPPGAAGASKRSSGDGVLSSQLDNLSPRRKSSIASQQCVTSDPRQRLARLLDNAPLINERKSNMTKKPLRSTSNKVVSVISPKSAKSSNVSSGSRDYRESYTSVFDQLDSLMTAEAERIDRNSFGESMIHALTPAKSHSKVRSNSVQGQETGDDASSGSEEEVPFSPLYEQFVNAPSATTGMTRRSPRRFNTKAKRMARASSSNSRVSSGRPRDTPDRPGTFEINHLDRMDGTPIRTSHNETSESPSNSLRSGMSTLTDHDRASMEDTISQPQVKVDQMDTSKSTPTRTEPSSSAESPSLFSLKSVQSSRTGAILSASEDIVIGQSTSQSSVHKRREDQAVRGPDSIFVSKSTNLPSIRGMPSLDSMDSDPLVSPSRLARQGSGPPSASPPVESLAVPRSPSESILQSFQNDFNVLVSEEVVEDAKIASVNEMPLDGAIEFPNIERLALSNAKRLESEMASLRNTISLLRAEKSTSEEILRQICSILKLDGALVPPEAVEALKRMFDQFDQSKKSIEDLRNQLEASRVECNELTQKLEAIQGNACELSESFNLVKKEVAETRRQRDAELERSAVLESEIINLRVQQDGHGMQISTLTSFFVKINALLGTNVDDSAALDVEQHEISFDSIRQLGENDGVMKHEMQKMGLILGEALERESLAKQAKDELQWKVSRLEDESRLASEANSRTESKRRDAEQLAEEAVSSNETLTAQIDDLKSKSKALEDEKVALVSKVEDLLESNRIMEKEHDMSSLEISKLKISLDARNDEKRQFKERLESIKLKTAEVMKQSIESLKKEYTTRLEEYKSEMVRQEAQIDELKMKEAAVDDSGEQVSQLKRRVHDRDTEISSLRRRLDELNSASSSKIGSAESRVSQLLSQLELARNDATTQREQNEALKREVENLRGLMDIAEESVSELNRLKEVNERLNDTIRSQSAGCSSRGSRLDVPFEIQERRFAYDAMSVAKHDEDNFMLERVSTLMRENENNNISMRALQGENIALKGSIDDCANTIEHMQTEMRELKSIASQGMTNIRSRKQRDEDARRQLEKKLDSANKLIRALQNNHNGGALYRDEVSSVSEELSPTRSNRRQTTPNRLGHPSPFNDADNNTPSRISWKNRQEKTSFVAELSAEKELRYKAEEIAAGVLANSKSALQERDSEIEKLRSKLRQLSGKQRRSHTEK